MASRPEHGVRSETELKVMEMASEVAAREGCLIYDVRLLGSGSRRTLRVLIERDPGGAGIDDCANVSRGLSLLLDVNDVILGGAYELEVSTPGIDRDLVFDWHFARAIGKPVDFRLKEPLQLVSRKGTPIQQSQVRGVLEAFEDGKFKVKGPESEFVFGIENVSKAKVIFELKPSEGQKGPKKSSKKSAKESAKNSLKN